MYAEKNEASACGMEAAPSDSCPLTLHFDYDSEGTFTRVKEGKMGKQSTTLGSWRILGPPRAPPEKGEAHKAKHLAFDRFSRQQSPVGCGLLLAFFAVFGALGSARSYVFVLADFRLA